MFRTISEEPVEVLAYITRKDRDGQPVLRKKGAFQGTAVEDVQVLGPDGVEKLPLHPSVNGDRAAVRDRVHLVVANRSFATTRQYNGMTFADEGRDYEVVGFNRPAGSKAA